MCQCRGSALERGAGWAISCLRSVAHAHDTYGVCTMYTVFVHHLAVSLRCFTDDWAPADSHAWPRIFEKEVDSRQPTDGRGCRENAVAAKSDAVTACKCTITDACRRLRTLIPGAWLLLLLRVTVSNRTPVWLGLNPFSSNHYDMCRTVGCLITNVLFSLWRHNLLCVHEATVGNYREGNGCEIIWSELWRLRLYLL